jgi:hypothetical protein
MQSRYAIIGAVLVVFLAAQVFGLFAPKAGPGLSSGSDGVDIRQMMIAPAVKDLPTQIVENPI